MRAECKRSFREQLNTYLPVHRITLKISTPKASSAPLEETWNFGLETTWTFAFIFYFYARFMLWKRVGIHRSRYAYMHAALTSKPKHMSCFHSITDHSPVSERRRCYQNCLFSPRSRCTQIRGIINFPLPSQTRLLSVDADRKRTTRPSFLSTSQLVFLSIRLVFVSHLTSPSASLQ